MALQCSSNLYLTTCELQVVAALNFAHPHNSNVHACCRPSSCTVIAVLAWCNHYTVSTTVWLLQCTSHSSSSPFLHAVKSVGTTVEILSIAVWSYWANQYTCVLHYKELYTIINNPMHTNRDSDATCILSWRTVQGHSTTLATLQWYRRAGNKQQIYCSQHVINQCGGQAS